MTENKRFTTNNGVFYKDNETGWEFECYGEVVELMNKLADENKTFREALKELKEIGDYQSERINELNDENEQLKQALKNHYINEICENCKFGHYDVDWYGEGEFECLKGHEGWKCDGKTECEDFELDLERFLK